MSNFSYFTGSRVGGLVKSEFSKSSLQQPFPHFVCMSPTNLFVQILFLIALLHDHSCQEQCIFGSGSDCLQCTPVFPLKLSFRVFVPSGSRPQSAELSRAWNIEIRSRLCGALKQISLSPAISSSQALPMSCALRTPGGSEEIYALNPKFLF